MKADILKKIFTSLGENNKAVYAVMAIAVAKGILRPLFTMMDKKQDPESRKYAAIREGLTEAIACPTYFTFGVLANKFAPKFLDKNLVRVGSEKTSDLLVLNDSYMSKFDDLIFKKTGSNEANNLYKAAVNAMNKQEKALFKNYKSKLRVVKESTGFLGVCLAAVFVIPALCNVVLNPVLKASENKNIRQNTINSSKTFTNNDKAPICHSFNSIHVRNAYNPNLYNAYKQAKMNFGMKVGVR